MRSFQNIVVTCLVVAVLATIWIPIVFGDIATDPWVKWIYNYQTLITGFVAAGAAYFTVKEMRRSTEQQFDMKHAELQRLRLPEIHKMSRCDDDLSDILFDLGYTFDFLKMVSHSDKSFIDQLEAGIVKLEKLERQYFKFQRRNYDEIPGFKRRRLQSVMKEASEYKEELKELKSQGFVTGDKSIDHYVCTLEYKRDRVANVIFEILDWLHQEYPEVKAQRL